MVIDVGFSCMRVSRNLGLLKGGLGGMLSGHAVRFGCLDEVESDGYNR